MSWAIHPFCLAAPVIVYFSARLSARSSACAISHPALACQISQHRLHRWLHCRPLKKTGQKWKERNPKHSTRISNVGSTVKMLKFKNADTTFKGPTLRTWFSINFHLDGSLLQGHFQKPSCFLIVCLSYLFIKQKLLPFKPNLREKEALTVQSSSEGAQSPLRS